MPWLSSASIATTYASQTEAVRPVSSASSRITAEAKSSEPEVLPPGEVGGFADF